METEEANETEGQSSGQHGLQAQVVITVVSGIFISRKARLHSSNILYTLVWQVVYSFIY